jgi:lysozyme
MSRDQLRLALIRDEGSGPVKMGRLFPYTDTVGKTTLGFGRNLTDRGISLGEAHTLLDNDIDDALKDLLIRFPWAEQMDPTRQAVLVMMIFNMGVHTFCAFKQTLGLVKRGDYEAASVQMLASRWSEQVGDRALRLAEQMRTGRWI